MDVVKGFSFFRGAIVALAMVGVVFPQTRLFAEQKSPTKPTFKVLAANSILDVSLNKNGEFTGRAVNQSGSPVEGATVVVKQGQTEVAQSVTDENGMFSVQNLKSGTYQVSSGATEGAYRFWSEKSAPPSAKAYGLLVLGENGSRGQYGCCDDCSGGMSGLLLVGAGAAALAVGIAALIIATDAQRKANNAFHSP